MKINEFWSKSSIPQKIIYCIYILSFLIASFNHLRDIISGGFFPYTNYPLWGNIYWTLLTFIDPLAIIILLLSLKIGRRLVALIIFSILFNCDMECIKIGENWIERVYPKAISKVITVNNQIIDYVWR